MHNGIWGNNSRDNFATRDTPDMEARPIPHESFYMSRGQRLCPTITDSVGGWTSTAARKIARTLQKERRPTGCKVAGTIHLMTFLHLPFSGGVVVYFVEREA